MTAAEADAPILRIETGMHTAMINRGSLSANGKLLLTASDDKTARLWSLPDLTLIRTLRPPIGPDDIGRLYAAALSPDGLWAAVGGFTGPKGSPDYVYIFSTADGSLVRTLDGLPDVASHLMFSPLGTHLAAGLGGKAGIRVWRSGKWGEAATDAEYGDTVYGLVFAQDGRLATVSDDGNVRLYDPDLHLLVKRKTEGGKEPFSLAFSPDGSNLAIGFADTAKVELRAASDLSLRGFTDDTDADRDLHSVAWSPDGRGLMASGRYSNANNESYLRVWNWREGKTGTFVDYQTSIASTTMGILPHPNIGTVIVSQDPQVLILDSQFNRTKQRLPGTLDFRDISLRLSTDGSRIGFGVYHSPKYWVFDAPQRQLTAADAPDLAPPITSAEGMETAKWKNRPSPTLNGQVLALDAGEDSRAIALNGNRALLGSDWSLRLFDREAKPLWPTEISPGAVSWAVNISGDGRLAVSALGDGTIRWYRMSDGTHLLSLFPHADGERWVAWTPSGYYAASVGGEDLIGWHVNRGQGQAADFFPASRFRDRFYRPDVVSLILHTLDEDKALARAEAGNPAPRGAVPESASPAGISALLPPVVAIAPLGTDNILETRQGVLSYRIRAAADAPPTHLRITSNGVWQGDFPVAGEADGSATGSIPLAFPTGTEARLEVVAHNRHGVSAPASATVTLPNDDPAANLRKRDLYILAVGIGPRYPEAVGGPLAFPPKDAMDFVDAMMTQQNHLYGKITPRAIPDGQASRQAVLDGLSWLQRSVTTNDVGMVFLAGHGTSDSRGRFYFLTPESDPSNLEDTAVSGEEIRNRLAETKGLRFMFLDACRAGAITEGKRVSPADITSFINQMVYSEAGTVLFAASRPMQSSLESKDWNNGAFTKALVEGLRGKAGGDDPDIRIGGLFDWVSRQVEILTKGRQTPTVAIPHTISNLVIAVKP